MTETTGSVFVQRLKLRAPQILPAWIGRPNVERHFGPDTSVLALVAGPGYGKTVAAAQVLAAVAGPRFWYRIDEHDADLAVFSAHLDALLAGSPGGASESRDGEARHLGSAKEIGSRVAESLARFERPVVVFDDVHLIEDGRALPLLGEVIERGARAGARFVLCGHALSLPLHGIVAASRLARAGPLDLAFDDREASRYLAASVPGLDPAAADDLVRSAEGWPAGLALLAAAVARTSLPAPPVRACDDATRRALFEGLAETVFAPGSGAERDVLLDSAVLDYPDVTACGVVSPHVDAAAALGVLAGRGDVVALGEGGFAVHPLLRDFCLRALARERTPDAIAALHLRAADACALRGDEAGAIAHALAGGASDAARRLERSVSAMLAAGCVTRVAGLLARVGDERVATSAALTSARGRVELQRGDRDGALRSFEGAIATARARAEFDAMAEAVRACAPLLASRGDYARLRTLLDETLALEPQLSERSVTEAYITLGAFDLDMERFDRAIEAFERVMPAVVARGDLSLQGIVLHNVAVAHVRRGDPYGGLALYERALAVKRAAGQRVSALITLANMSFAQRLIGDLEEAERLTERLLDDARDVGTPFMVAYALENDGALKLARGDAEGAEAAYGAALRACDPDDVTLLPHILHGLGQAALARGRYAEGDDVCARAAAIVLTTPQRQAAAPFAATRAECALQRGDVSVAFAFARDALDLARAGSDPVTHASVCIDVAALLVRVAPRLGREAAAEAERAAADAATTAVALIHERDYRFLLRTKARTFAALHDQLRRWNVGAGLLPEAAALRGPLGMRVDLLGGLRVFVGGEPLPSDAWKRRKAREIFAYLVALRGRAVTRARLVEHYFPDMAAEAAHDNLRVTVSAIRKAVGDVVKFESNGYRFVAPPGTTVDVASFDDHVDAARRALARGDRDEARRRYVQAASLYRGDFLEGSEDGARHWRERERLRAASLEALRWLATDTGGERGARRLALDRLLEAAPYDLDAVRMRLETLTADLRVADARRAYEEWRASYRGAVGADPPDVWPRTAPEAPGAPDAARDEAAVES